MSDIITPKERPVLMSVPMVRATLRDVAPKTHTRRVMKPQPTLHKDGSCFFFGSLDAEHHQPAIIEHCPYGQPGDRLWVRETFCPGPRYNPAICRHRPCYAADNERNCGMNDKRWLPSIHMPRWASRITLEIASVRVERLQAISETDAQAEGVMPEFEMDVASFVKGAAVPQSTYFLGFKHLWDEINGKRPGCSWADNPWVWVIEFRRILAGLEAV